MKISGSLTQRNIGNNVRCVIPSRRSPWKIGHSNAPNAGVTAESWEPDCCSNEALYDDIHMLLCRPVGLGSNQRALSPAVEYRLFASAEAYPDPVSFVWTFLVCGRAIRSVATAVDCLMCRLSAGPGEDDWEGRTGQKESHGIDSSPGDSAVFDPTVEKILGGGRFPSYIFIFIVNTIFPS